MQPAGDRGAPAARLSLTGPLDAPTRAIDADALITYLAARQAHAPEAATPAPQRAKAPADGARR